jgi:uncharacterized protein YdaU (DUF1376 family)
MSAPAWMPLYVADYLADTAHLTTVQHGAYMLLIMHYWRSRGLPADDKKLARICRVSPSQWKTMRATLSDLFQDGWRHKRIDAELLKADLLCAKRMGAGKASAKSRKRFNMASTHVEHMSNQSPSPREEQFPINRELLLRLIPKGSSET